METLPQSWDENFPFRHLNMDFDQPIPIKLRIYPGARPGTDYTFLYGWFGDTFHYERTETEPPYGDIVRVWCGSFSMVNGPSVCRPRRGPGARGGPGDGQGEAPDAEPAVWPGGIEREACYENHVAECEPFVRDE